MEVTRVLSRVLFAGTLLLTVTVGANKLPAQSLDKVRLCYSGTGINNYVLEMGRRQGIFRKNGLDLEVVYVNSGSLLSQALIAGTFDLSMSQGSEAMIAKLRGADVRIVAVIANRFNHVYLTAPSITSFKQLKGKKVAVSRFGSGSHFQTNLALKDGGLDPEKDVTILQIGKRQSGHPSGAENRRSRDHRLCAHAQHPSARSPSLPHSRRHQNRPR